MSLVHTHRMQTGHPDSPAKLSGRACNKDLTGMASMCPFILAKYMCINIYIYMGWEAGKKGVGHAHSTQSLVLKNAKALQLTTSSSMWNFGHHWHHRRNISPCSVHCPHLYSWSILYVAWVRMMTVIDFNPSCWSSCPSQNPHFKRLWLVQKTGHLIANLQASDTESGF